MGRGLNVYIWGSERWRKSVCMRSDRKKVNCHDSKAYFPAGAGELELFAV